MVDHKSTDLVAQHTPGPWKISKEGYVGAGQFGNNPVVAKVAQFFGPGDRQRYEADRHLIAAAPDLLALAEQYASECSECDGNGRTTTWENNVPDDITKGIHEVLIDCPDCADIRQIIRKAKGS